MNPKKLDDILSLMAHPTQLAKRLGMSQNDIKTLFADRIIPRMLATSIVITYSGNVIPTLHGA